MKTIYTKTVKNTYVLVGMVPISKEDVEKLQAFKKHQILKNQTSGVLKARSLKQHRWAMWMIRSVSENDSDVEWNTFGRAKRRIKLAMKFFKDEVVVEGNKVYFELDSFAFDEMPQSKATKVYNEVKTICAQRLGCSPEELEANAKREA